MADDKKPSLRDAVAGTLPEGAKEAVTANPLLPYLMHLYTEPFRRAALAPKTAPGDTVLPFVRSPEADAKAHEVGIVGKVLGALGFGTKERDSQSWGKAWEATRESLDPMGMVDDIVTSGRNLGQMGSGLRPFDPGPAAMDFANVYFGSAPAALLARPQGSLLGTMGSRTRKPFERAPDLDALGFYSQAERAMGKIPMKKGSLQQWLNAMKKQGVKDAEIKALGLEEAFADKPSITADEIGAHVKEKRLRLRREERRKDEGYSDEEILDHAWESESAAMREHYDDVLEVRPSKEEEGQFAIYNKDTGEEVAQFRSEREADRQRERYVSEYADDDAKFAVEDLDVDQYARDAGLDRGSSFDSYIDGATDSYFETLLKTPKDHPFQYGGNHWSEPGLIVSTLSDEMEEVLKGTTGRWLHEIQSDPAQRARKQGGFQAAPEQVERFRLEEEAARAERDRLAAGTLATEAENWRRFELDPEKGGSEADLRRYVALQDFLARDFAGVPPARFLRWAEESGIDIPGGTPLADVPALIRPRLEADLTALAPRVREVPRERVQAIEDARLRLHEAEIKHKGARSGIPDGPFLRDTGDWTRVGLAAEIYDAAKSGRDWFAVDPTGAVERWGDHLKDYYERTIPDVLAKLMKPHGAKKTRVVVDPDADLSGIRGYHITDPMDSLREVGPIMRRLDEALGGEPDARPFFPDTPGAQGELFPDPAKLGRLPTAPFEYSVRPHDVTMIPKVDYTGAPYTGIPRSYEGISPSYAMVAENGQPLTGGGVFRTREGAEKALRELQRKWDNPDAILKDPKTYPPEAVPAYELTPEVRDSIVKKGFSLYTRPVPGAPGFAIRSPFERDDPQPLPPDFVTAVQEGRGT